MAVRWNLLHFGCASVCVCVCVWWKGARGGERQGESAQIWRVYSIMVVYAECMCVAYMYLVIFSPCTFFPFCIRYV